MIIYMKVCNTKGVLVSWKQWFSYIIEKKIKIKISAHFQPIFDFELRGKRSRAELKILQLEPARLGLITSMYAQELRLNPQKGCSNPSQIQTKQTNKADWNKYDQIASECSGVGLSCEMQELHLKISSRIKRNGRRIGKRTRALCPVFLNIFLKLK